MHFRVQKAPLAAASKVFADMLEVGTSASTEVAEVPLAEPAGVLEAVLDVCYKRNKLAVARLGAAEFWGVLDAFDKYDVRSKLVRAAAQGRDAVDASFCTGRSPAGCRPSPGRWRKSSPRRTGSCRAN